MRSDQLFAQGFATQRSIAVEMAQIQNQIAELLGDKSYAFISNERFNNKLITRISLLSREKKQNKRMTRELLKNCGFKSFDDIGYTFAQVTVKQKIALQETENTRAEYLTKFEGLKGLLDKLKTKSIESKTIRVNGNSMYGAFGSRQISQGDFEIPLGFNKEVHDRTPRDFDEMQSFLSRNMIHIYGSMGTPTNHNDGMPVRDYIGMVSDKSDATSEVFTKLNALRTASKVDVITIDSIPEDGLRQGEILVSGKGLNHPPDIIHTLSNSSQGNLELKVSKNRKKTQHLHVSLEHDKAWCDAFEVQSEASKEFDEKLVLENFYNVVSKLDLGNKGDK